MISERVVGACSEAKPRMERLPSVFEHAPRACAVRELQVRGLARRDGRQTKIVLERDKLCTVQFIKVVAPKGCVIQRAVVRFAENLAFRVRARRLANMVWVVDFSDLLANAVELPLLLLQKSKVCVVLEHTRQVPLLSNAGRFYQCGACVDGATREGYVRAHSDILLGVAVHRVVSGVPVHADGLLCVDMGTAPTSLVFVLHLPTATRMPTSVRIAGRVLDEREWTADPATKSLTVWAPLPLGVATFGLAWPCSAAGVDHVNKCSAIIGSTSLVRVSHGVAAEAQNGRFAINEMD